MYRKLMTSPLPCTQIHMFHKMALATGELSELVAFFSSKLTISVVVGAVATVKA